MGEAGPSELWRTSLRSAGLEAGGSTAGVQGASHWRMHMTEPVSVLASCPEQGCVLFDHAQEKLIQLIHQPFLASAAALGGSLLCLGHAEGASVVRINWSKPEETTSAWQQYSLDTSGGGIGTRAGTDVCIVLPSERHFGTADNARYHVWDLNRQDTPLLSVGMWGLETRSSAGDGHVNGTLSAVGSSRGELRLLDHRDKSAERGVAHAAHVGRVSAVGWHPHVSHWLGTGGADGALRVWDMRWLRECVAEQRLAHGGGVVGLAWSPSHSELMASVGVDRSLGLWNVRLPGQAGCVGGRAALSLHRPLGVGWFGRTALVGDARGNLASLSISEAFLQPQCPPGPREEALRRMIYTRDLASAFPLVVERAQLCRSEGQLDAALELVESCYPRTLVATPTDDVRAAFHRDVLEVASFLPPSYPMPSEVGSAMRLLKRLRTILVLQQMCEKNLWREALAYGDELCAFLAKGTANSSAPLTKGQLQLSPELVRQVVDMVMRHHYLSGLAFGARILRAVRENEFIHYASLTRALLSPTVFDGFAGGVGQAATDLDHVLHHQNVGLSQVDFVRDFTARMWTENAWARVEKMMRKTERMLVSVSATVNRVYLGSLLQTGHFATFFLAATVVAQAAASCEFATQTLPNVVVPAGAIMGLEWGRALCEGLAAGQTPFMLPDARALVRMCAAMTLRAAAMIPKALLDEASRLLQNLVRHVPDAPAGLALRQEVETISALGVLGSDEITRTFLSVLAMKIPT